jgi:hypothetical protein
MSWPGVNPSFVMAGLVPATHVFACLNAGEDVDARHKAGHDGQ